MRKDKALLKLLSNPRVLTRIHSPSISRTIPVLLRLVTSVNEWWVVGAVSLLLLGLIVSRSIQINGQIRELAEREARHDTISREVIFWEDVTKKYPDYRDGYFRLALLEYQLGERQKASDALGVALQLDPRFQPGLTFKQKLDEK